MTRISAGTIEEIVIGSRDGGIDAKQRHRAAWSFPAAYKDAVFLIKKFDGARIFGRERSRVIGTIAAADILPRLKVLKVFDSATFHRRQRIVNHLACRGRNSKRLGAGTARVARSPWISADDWAWLRLMTRPAGKSP